MDISQGFIAREEGLTFYNAQALINLTFVFVYDDGTDELDFDFIGYVSAYFRVYDGKKREQLLKNFSNQITRNASVLIMNCSISDMTFEDHGPYFFELGYNRSGYEIPLRFGKLIIL